MTSSLLRFSKSVFSFAALILVGAALAAPTLLVPVSASAESPSCRAASHDGFSQQIFDDYYESEYVEGLLVLHFKLKATATDGRTFAQRLYYYDNECGEAVYQFPSTEISITPDVEYWSIRFTSPTTFEVWNDEDDVHETCANCTMVIPALPAYFEVALWHFEAGFLNNTYRDRFRSSSHRILEDAADTPEFVDTLPAPAGCPSFEKSGWQPGNFWLDYERAGYQDNGFLAVHLRAPLSNNTFRFHSALRLHDEECVRQTSVVVDGDHWSFASHEPTINFELPPWVQYFSIRFASTTHYDLWDDYSNTIIDCPACSVDIPETLANGYPYSYVSLRLLTHSALSSAELTTTPFSIQDPNVEVAVCCSSVVFLPGLQASRLYQQGLIFENQLWEPNRNADALKLMMNGDGQSIEQGIYTRDIIGESNLLTPDDHGGFNVYKEFSTSMDTLVTDGIITEWAPFPYDWRYDLSDIIERGVDLENGGYEMLGRLEALAARSPTKKVTIIGHSNGGFLGKLLVTHLEKEGKADLVDQFIMVGTPQLGTPKAIAGLLHGYEQDLPKKIGVFLAKSTARQIAENMPGAYTLLPSDEYFTQVVDPVVTFDAAAGLTDAWHTCYGDEISSPAALAAFLTGSDCGEMRQKPEIYDTLTPNVLNTTLLTNAAAMHAAQLDHWVAPENVDVVQIVGWGLDTMKGMRYTEHDCPIGTVCTLLDAEPIFTIEGDKTVVWKSAGAMETQNATTYFLNLSQQNRGLKRNRQHADILETDSVRILLAKLVAKQTESLPQYIQTDKYEPDNENDRLRLSVHSPVSLSAIDSFGHYTGFLDNPDPDSDLQRIAEEIPNSYYMELGDGKYLGLDFADDYTVILRGTDGGTFTFKIHEVTGDAVGTTTEWSDISVIERSIISLILATTSEPRKLMMDADGDGAIDVEIAPGAGLSLEEFLPIFRSITGTMDFSDQMKSKIFKALDKFERVIEKEEKCDAKEVEKQKGCAWRTKKKLGRILDQLIVHLNTYKHKGTFDPVEGAALITVIEGLRGRMVKS